MSFNPISFNEKIFALSTASISLLHCSSWSLLQRRANQKFDGDYTSTLTEAHVGWETDLGKSSKFYIQGGPAFKFVDDGDNQSLASGKVGIKSALTERLSVYGELKAYSGDEYNFDTLAVGVKTGVKYGLIQFIKTATSIALQRKGHHCEAMSTG